jgi:hypothetical protein
VNLSPWNVPHTQLGGGWSVIQNRKKVLPELAREFEKAGQLVHPEDGKRSSTAD